MSFKAFLGRAPVQTQRTRYTFSDTTNTNTTILTLTNGNSNGTDAETWTNGGAETTSTISAGIAALIEKSSNGLFARLSANDLGSGVVEVFSKYAGEPFSLAITGTMTGTTTTVINETGHPGDWNCESNWAGGALPSGGDDILIAAGASVIYNLYQSGTTYGKITVAGQAGFPGAPLKCGCTALDFMDQGGGHFDVNSSAITVNARGAGRMVVIGSAIAAANVFNNADLSIAPYAGQTSTVTGDVVNYGGIVTIGSTAAVGGIVKAQRGLTRVISTGTVDQVDIYAKSTVFIDPGADVTLANLYGGDLQYDRASAAIATLNEYGGEATVDAGS